MESDLIVHGIFRVPGITCCGKRPYEFGPGHRTYERDQTGAAGFGPTDLTCQACSEAFEAEGVALRALASGQKPAGPKEK